MLVVGYGQVWWPDIWYWWHQQSNVVYSVDAPRPGGSSQISQIVPKSTSFGLVIEKINVNELVAEQVDPFTPLTYLPVLQRYGVAQAKGSVAPGQVGTTYLFGHSTVNFWEIGRYHAPFTLMNKLGKGDRIVTYYNHQRYDYVVTDRKVVSPKAVHYLTDKRDTPTLIIQTCDPPGENTKRLLLIATLQGKAAA